MNSIDDIAPILKKLRLSGLFETMDLRIRQAVEDNLSHPEFLYRLLCDEVERREGKQLQLRLRRACFDHAKSLEDFEFQFNPQIPKARILDLATCSFIARHENIALIGPTGVGKSHICQALGHRACMAGHQVLYVQAHEMFTQLRASRADNTYERKMLRFTGPDLLLVDDLGLQALKFDEPLDLYEVIRKRYERGSLVITSNRAVDEWYPLFQDDLLASAALDRFLHHSHIVIMEGVTYRNPPRSRKTKKASETACA